MYYKLSSHGVTQLHVRRTTEYNIYPLLYNRYTWSSTGGDTCPILHYRRNK